ncbi:MAG: ATP-binding protein [Bacteroidales bacterium]|nr:ATP-binding protein [Bacteroidales bacterium]
MNKELLKTILIENQKEVLGYKVLERNIEVTDEFNYAFVGIRRAGKSYLMYQQIQKLYKKGIGWDEMLYLNFEDERLLGFGPEDFNLILETHLEMYGKKPILFLDEIQNVEYWHKFARRLADQKYRVYITGSNAKMLSSEIMTTLGGRYIMVNVFPYSFAEYANIHRVKYDPDTLCTTAGRAAVQKLFNEYFRTGGFPEIATAKSKNNYLISLYQKIYLGDIAARNGITNTLGLKVMLKKLAEGVRQPVSYNRIASIVSSVGSKLSTSSAIKYIDHTLDSWMLLKVTNFAAKVSERESIAKYYFIDNGLLNLLIFDSNPALLENLAALVLLRKYGIEDIVFFYNRNIEVDFVLPMEGTAIQVSYSIMDPDTREREVRALVAIKSIMEIRRAIILTYSEEETIQADGLEIEVIPMWKFVLEMEG